MPIFAPIIHLRKEMKLRFILLSVLVGWGLAGCSHEEDTPIASHSPRTILVYMLANNSLNSYAVQNIRSMVAGASSANLNDGNLLVYFSARGTETDSLFLIKDNTKQVLQTYEGQESNDPAVMQEVIQEVINQYPADSYGLVLWSHGTAWLPSTYSSLLRAFGQEGNSWMEIDELAEGLPDNTFDFILFDACYMASIECAYELRNKAHYILASPTETLADGWPYEEMLSQLFATNLQLEEVGQTFYDSYQNSSAPYATVSLTQTDGLDSLKTIVHEILSDKTESDLYSLDLSTLQRLDYLYSSNYPGMLYDFADYIRALATDEQYERFTACLEEVVPYKAHTDRSYYAAIQRAVSVSSYSGLTVYVPTEYTSQIFDWYKTRVSWYTAVYE